MDYKTELQLAREYAASISQAVIDDPNIPEGLKEVHKDIVKSILSGELDNNFTVAQRMEYFLTGQDHPLLP